MRITRVHLVARDGALIPVASAGPEWMASAAPVRGRDLPPPDVDVSFRSGSSQILIWFANALPPANGLQSLPLLPALPASPTRVADSQDCTAGDCGLQCCSEPCPNAVRTYADSSTGCVRKHKGCRDHANSS